MDEYEYRIPLFGPNYWNSQIVRIIRSNTGMDQGSRQGQVKVRLKSGSSESGLSHVNLKI